MGYGEERVDLLGRLGGQLSGRALPDALRLDGRALRFHLGTALADLRVPVHVDEAIASALTVAARDLCFLLCVRHRAVLPEGEYDNLILLDGFDPRAARPVSFSAPQTVKGENVRRAFLEAPEMHPALDSGLVASWLASGRPGRALAGALAVALRRAGTEASAADPPEPTPYIALLALRARAQHALGELKGLPLGGAVGRSLLGAVAAGLLVAIRLAAREAGVFDGAHGIFCESACLALPWLGSQRLLWGSGLSAYGVSFLEAPPRIEQHAESLLQGASAADVARAAAADLSSLKANAQKAARQVALAKIRSDVLSALRLAESGKAPMLSVEGTTAGQLFQSPGALEGVLSASSSRKDLEKRARAGAKASSSDVARDLFEAIATAAKKWDDDNPARWLERDFVPRAWGAAVAALAVDLALERALAQAEGQLAHRSGRELEGGIEEQHAAGKLYLIGVEDKPILLGRTRAMQMGHLFCDIKDFTKRTAFLKETVVADFLSREFYGPILTAAAHHAHGAAHLADRGGIYLNNLLGDAISFSGDVASLVELASEIRAALGSYALRLASEETRDELAAVIAAIEERYRARREELAGAVKSAQDAQRRGSADQLSGEEPRTRLLALSAQLQALEEERESELALARGEKLEAGIFISYGAAPEVATFEDHIFGPIKVSIAEKINESARGTARNSGVRARVDALLAAERARRRAPALTCPLQVSVSRPMSIPVPADAELMVRRSLAEGDTGSAEAVLSGVAREFLARAVEDSSPERGDIYNGGVALSEEALEALIQARADDLVFLPRDLDVAELHPALRERFVFPMRKLRLVAAMSHSSGGMRELFVHVGRALFKGFERKGGLPVYEMIARESSFFALVAEHHASEWMTEHEQGLAPDRDELQRVAGMKP